MILKKFVILWKLEGIKKRTRIQVIVKGAALNEKTKQVLYPKASLKYEYAIFA